MEIVNVILEDDIVVVYKNNKNEHEMHRYNFFGYPSGELDACISAPPLPEWIVTLAKSHMDNNHVVIAQFSKIDEDDFEYLLNRKRNKNINKLIEGAIFTDVHPGHIFDYMEDFIGVGDE